MIDTPQLTRLQKEIESTLLEATNAGDLTRPVIAAIASYVEHLRAAGQSPAEIVRRFTHLIHHMEHRAHGEDAKLVLARARAACTEAAYLPQ